jgi:hypothetical protein
MKSNLFSHCRRISGLVTRSLSAVGIAIVAWLLAPANLTAAPTVTTITGGPSAGYVDGDTTVSALFHTPIGLALDSTGNYLYVADRDNNAVRELDLAGNLTFTFATGINQPVGLAVDADDNVYVLSRGNGSDGKVLQFDVFGDLLATITSGLVNANGMAIDSEGNLYVTVNNNRVIQISSAGVTTTVITITNANTVLQGIAVTDTGNLAVCDSGRNGVLVINPLTAAVTNLTGFNGAGDHFGTAPFAQFNHPYGVAAAGNGVLVVTDYGNNRVKVVNSVGTVTNLYGVDSSFWVTGDGTLPGWWDGTVARGDINYNARGFAESRLPAGVILSGDASIVYTTEDYYHLIRMVTGAGLPALPPPPPPPPAVPAPAVGWVDFTVPPAIIVSILRTNQPFVFNNDVTVAIAGTDGAETHYTFGATGTSIPNPDATTGSTPPPYHDGMFPSQVPPSIVPIMPDVTVKAIGVAPLRPSSFVVTARFQFKTANPVVTGDNAALFTVTDQTTNALMYYTIDGSDPTNAAPSIGPITSGTTLSLNGNTNVTFKIRAFRADYQKSDIVTKKFFASSFVPNSITFGFPSGEASSDFIASPGQLFYAPVTMSIVPGTKIYSLQFNLTVTNGGPNPGPVVAPGAYGFQSFLVKPIPGISPPAYEIVPPLMFSAYAINPPPPGQIVRFDGQPFVNLTFTNSANNLLGVGWLERFGSTNLYDSTKQDLIATSQPHDTLFLEANGSVVLGGYGFKLPATSTAGQTYKIQIGLPSATSDGIGAPGSAVFISTPTNGSLTAGAVNSIKIVTTGQRKYIAGDAAPFRWFNAGDFGNTNLDNSDVMQVFQSAIYGVNYPPAGSDFFDAMDACGRLYVDNGNGYLAAGSFVSGATALNPLFDGDDTSINDIGFGDGVLDVCDVYVTLRRSLDTSLVRFRRFWTNGVPGAEIVSAQAQALLAGTPRPLALSTPLATDSSVNFSCADFRATAGQTVQIPVTAQILGSYPLRVLMLSLSVNPLDGSPALTSPVQFTPNPSLGVPSLTSSSGNGNYAATWLNSAVAGLSNNATIGTLTVTIPAGAPGNAAYAVHFDHASASPNGLAAFPRQTTSGLITLADRSASTYGDGIPDSWRLRYFGTANNLLSQASADADGDGASNLQEYLAGTDPTDPASCLRVAVPQPTNTQPQDRVIRWPSVVGKRYVIEGSSSLFAPNWTGIATNTGTGANMEFHDSTGGNVRFYRVRVAP